LVFAVKDDSRFEAVLGNLWSSTRDATSCFIIEGLSRRAASGAGEERYVGRVVRIVPCAMEVFIVRVYLEPFRRRSRLR